VTEEVDSKLAAGWSLGTSPQIVIVTDADGIIASFNKRPSVPSATRAQSASAG